MVLTTILWMLTKIASVSIDTKKNKNNNQTHKNAWIKGTYTAEYWC